MIKMESIVESGNIRTVDRQKVLVQLMYLYYYISHIRSNLEQFGTPVTRYRVGYW